jgi:oligoendopeptidase F
MYKFSRILITALIILVSLPTTRILSQSRERSDVPTGYKWKLEDLYPTEQAWNQAKEKLVPRFDEIEKYKGKLTDSASELLACLELNSEISKEFGRLFSYASMKSDEDVRDSKNLAMKQELQQLGTDYSSKSAFITPEIAEMDK